MAKALHEIRDPIHVFARVSSDERLALNSRPVQRLRHIHQLALSYLVYPGATHMRFEHSLGVMELAGRVFDVVTQGEALDAGGVRDLVPEATQPQKRDYWRGVLRLAALCHDIGHLPFSHAAEKDLLPSGWTHERLSQELILSPEMRKIWEQMVPRPNPEHIVKLAVGRKISGMQYSNWEAILSEIIVGDAFGVDRMDYLLRDSYHAGVAYGRFDHFRLIDTLRILPSTDTQEPTLGVEDGGLQSAEAMALARYFMFTQVYFHPVRRAYDLHLREFMNAWLPGGRIPTKLNSYLALTDNEVSAAVTKAMSSPKSAFHPLARRIAAREHFKELYRRNPEDVRINPESGKQIAHAAGERYGSDAIFHDAYPPKGNLVDFPVLGRERRVSSALLASQVLRDLPVAAFDYVFVDEKHRADAEAWLKKNRDDIIKPEGGEQ
jgi:HD superfamily phosphohydrolase